MYNAPLTLRNLLVVTAGTGFQNPVTLPAGTNGLVTSNAFKNALKAVWKGLSADNPLTTFLNANPNISFTVTTQATDDTIVPGQNTEIQIILSSGRITYTGLNLQVIIATT